MLRISIVDDELGDLVDVVRNLLSLDPAEYHLELFPVLLADPARDSPESVQRFVQENGVDRLSAAGRQSKWPKFEVLGKLCPVNREHKNTLLKYLSDRRIQIIFCDCWIGQDDETVSRYPDAVLELSGMMLLDAAEAIREFSGNCWMMTKHKQQVSSKLLDAASMADAGAWCPALFDPLNVRSPRYIDKTLIMKSKPGLCEPRLRRIIDEALAVHRLAESVQLPESVIRTGQFVNLVGKSPRMLDIYGTILRLSRTKLNVLVTGETGTGKRRVAEALCEMVPRRRGRFSSQNCGAFPEGAFEAMLCGYGRGAGFPNADPNGKPGLFEMAHGGVLFLDEIADMPEAQQVALFDILDNETVTRILDTRPLDQRRFQFDVRIVSATDQPLSKLRHQLLQRLNGYLIEMPALRNHLEDIPLLLESFSESHSRKMGTPMKAWSDDVIELLVCHDWPGNVRELENLVGKAVFEAGTGRLISPDNRAIREFSAKRPPVGTQQKPATTDRKHWSAEDWLRGIEARQFPVQNFKHWVSKLGDEKACELYELATKAHGDGASHLSDAWAQSLFGMPYHNLVVQVARLRKKLDMQDQEKV